MGGNGNHTRRTVLAIIGAGVFPGTVSGRGSQNEDEVGPVEFVAVAWTVDDLGAPEVEVTIRNTTDEEISVEARVNLYEDDTLLDDIDLRFSDVPDGTETSEARSVIDVEQEELDRVTHWEVGISEFDLFNGDETVYVFEGPVVPDEEIDIEDAEIAGETEETGEEDVEDVEDEDVDEAEEEAVEPIEFVDVAWTIGDLGAPEVEVTIRNNTDEEVSMDVTVRLFEGDTLLDDVGLLFSDVPDGAETSEDRSVIDVEQEELDRVTHWEVEIEEFALFNGDATVYVFEGPIVPDEEIDVEDAAVEEDG